AGIFKRSGRPEDSGVVSPAPFRAAGVNPLRAVKKGEGRFEIIVEETAQGLRAFAERGGKRIADLSSDRSLPPEIAYLVRSGYRQEMSLALFVFLKRAENRYPVYHRDGSRKSRIQWLGEVPCATWTELDVLVDEIVARKACSLELDKRVRGTLIGDFVFNDERTQMG